MQKQLSPPENSIARVVAEMDDVIERCLTKGDRLGYFATLYRDVTVKVADAIAAGRFQDGPRMERLDVIFAQRYLDAIAQHWHGGRPTRSWNVAFTTARRRSPIILQHLLLGMNAHINLDLAIAAAQTAPGDQLPALKRDFEEITLLLDEMIHDVQLRIELVSPWFGILDHIGVRTETRICSFCMEEARDIAWGAAQELALAGPDEFAYKIHSHDGLVAELAEAIRSPGVLLTLVLHSIRVRESRSVREIIRALRM